jgi:metal-responsive CopG/Arc/MetJ family transcriptional regulator
LYLPDTLDDENRMWRSSALRRAVRKVIAIEKGETETEEERQARLEAEYQASHEAARQAIINALETQAKVDEPSGTL